MLTNPDQYDKVIKQMQQFDGSVGEKLRSDFARIAFSLTASYDAAIADYLNRRQAVQFPEKISIALRKQAILRYGENPQKPGG